MRRRWASSPRRCSSCRSQCAPTARRPSHPPALVRSLAATRTAADSFELAQPQVLLRPRQRDLGECAACSWCIKLPKASALTERQRQAMTESLPAVILIALCIRLQASSASAWWTFWPFLRRLRSAPAACWAPSPGPPKCTEQLDEQTCIQRSSNGGTDKGCWKY